MPQQRIFKLLIIFACVVSNSDTVSSGILGPFILLAVVHKPVYIQKIISKIKLGNFKVKFTESLLKIYLDMV